MKTKYWTKNEADPEWILRNYMNMTDYAYHHTDLGMLDIECADLPEDERLDAAAEGILSEHPEEIMKEYEKDMVILLDGFFNMPANGKYSDCFNEGKVTDLTEKEGFKALFVDADRHMAKDFVKNGGHAWDGILDGYPIRFIKRGNGGISLTQTLSNSEYRRIYKAYVTGRDGKGPVLFMLCHCAYEIPIEGVGKEGYYTPKHLE